MDKKIFFEEKLDFYIATLIGIATFLGALAAYYSGVWGGNSTGNFNNGAVAMTKSSGLYAEASSNYNAYKINDLKDDLMYAEYVKASESGNEDDMEYFLSKMTPAAQGLIIEGDVSKEELAEIDRRFVAYEDSVFAVYDDFIAEGDSLRKYASKVFKTANDEGSNSDAFTIVTVLLTIALFFGGMASITKKNNLKLIYSVLFLGVFLYSCIRMFFIPFP